MSYSTSVDHFRCHTCGCAVLDTLQHDVWHKTVAERVTNVEELRRELAEEKQRNATGQRLINAYIAHRFTEGDTDAAFLELEAATQAWQAQQEDTNA